MGINERFSDFRLIYHNETQREKVSVRMPANERFRIKLLSRVSSGETLIALAIGARSLVCCRTSKQSSMLELSHIEAPPCPFPAVASTNETR